MWEACGGRKAEGVLVRRILLSAIGVQDGKRQQDTCGRRAEGGRQRDAESRGRSSMGMGASYCQQEVRA